MPRPARIRAAGGHNSTFFWYQLFGDLIGTLAGYGPAGWLALAIAGVVLARPAVTAAVPQLPAAVQAARGLHQAIAFRLQWRWRICATRHLAAAIPQLTGLNGPELGVLAGQLHRSRPRSTSLDHLTGYGLVQAGALTAITPTGDPVTLTQGATWDPRYRLSRATSRRTVLVAIESAAVERLQAVVAGISAG